MARQIEIGIVLTAKDGGATKTIGTVSQKVSDLNEKVEQKSHRMNILLGTMKLLRIATMLFGNSIGSLINAAIAWRGPNDAIVKSFKDLGKEAKTAAAAAGDLFLPAAASVGAAMRPLITATKDWARANREVIGVPLAQFAAGLAYVLIHVLAVGLNTVIDSYNLIGAAIKTWQLLMGEDQDTIAARDRRVEESVKITRELEAAQKALIARLGPNIKLTKQESEGYKLLADDMLRLRKGIVLTTDERKAVDMLMARLKVLREEVDKLNKTIERPADFNPIDKTKLTEGLSEATHELKKIMGGKLPGFALTPPDDTSHEDQEKAHKKMLEAWSKTQQLDQQMKGGLRETGLVLRESAVDVERLRKGYEELGLAADNLFGSGRGMTVSADPFSDLAKAQDKFDSEWNAADEQRLANLDKFGDRWQKKFEAAAQSGVEIAKLPWTASEKAAKEAADEAERSSARIGAAVGNLISLAPQMGQAFGEALHAMQANGLSTEKVLKQLGRTALQTTLSTVRSIIMAYAVEAAAAQFKGGAATGPGWGIAIGLALAATAMSIGEGFLSRVPRAARGGELRGGTPGRDSIMLMGKPGEVIVDTETVRDMKEVLRGARGPAAQSGDVHHHYHSTMPLNRTELRRMVRDVIEPEQMMLAHGG